MLSKVKSAAKSFRTRISSQSKSFSSFDETDLGPKSPNPPNNIDQPATRTNEEDVTIVWLQKNLKSVPDESLIESLRLINNYIQVFDDEEDALSYIESIFEEKVLLIIESISAHLLSVLEVLKQVEGVFLYTNEVIEEIPSRIKSVCSNEDQLLNEINQIRSQLDKQMIVFSIYNQKNNEKHDLTHEAGSFLFFQLFKAVFKNLPKNSESKKLMISKYRQYYSNNKQILKQLNDFESNYKSNDALQWYLNDTFIYRLINKALRTENMNSLSCFHFYIGDLSKQLEKEFKLFKKQDPKGIIKLYRSFKTTNEQIINFQHNIGNLILTNGYLSTTRQRQLALDFLNKQNQNANQENVLFEYIVDLSTVKSIILADISQYNQSSDQYEILFDLGTAFKMNSCKYDERDNCWLINVNATDEGVDVASEYIEYQKAKMTNSNIILMLGHLIIETGNYDKAEKYFNAMLNSSIPNDEEIACIYYNIGRVYRLKGDYDRALEYLNRAYVAHSEARPARLVSAAKAMNAIGIVCMELNNVQEAIDAFECALKLYTKTVQGYHPDVGGTLINLGNIYSEQGNFDNALSCFKRTEKIYQCNLPSNHPNVAILLNNMGNLYYQQGQFNSALDAYQRALDINEKILPPNHPVIEKNRHNLSKVYIGLGDQTNAQFQLKQASEYILFDINASVEAMRYDMIPNDINHNKRNSKSNVEIIEMNHF